MAEKFILYGDLRIEITEPVPVQPIWADAVTEIRVIDNVAFISLASIVTDGPDAREARVQARLRVPLATLYDLQRAVEGILSQVEQAKKNAN